MTCFSAEVNVHNDGQKSQWTAPMEVLLLTWFFALCDRPTSSGTFNIWNEGGQTTVSPDSSLVSFSTGREARKTWLFREGRANSGPRLPTKNCSKFFFGHRKIPSQNFSRKSQRSQKNFGKIYSRLVRRFTRFVIFPQSLTFDTVYFLRIFERGKQNKNQKNFAKMSISLEKDGWRGGGGGYWSVRATKKISQKCRIFWKGRLKRRRRRSLISSCKS